MPLSNFVPRGFGFVHHSIAILYYEVPNPNLTIRNFFIAVNRRTPILTGIRHGCFELRHSQRARAVAVMFAERRHHRLLQRRHSLHQQRAAGHRGGLHGATAHPTLRLLQRRGAIRVGQLLWRAGLLRECQYSGCCSTSSWIYGVVGTGLLWGVSTLCAVVPPPAGLYGVVGTGLLWDVSTLCAVAPPPGLDGVVGTGLL